MALDVLVTVPTPRWLRVEGHTHVVGGDAPAAQGEKESLWIFGIDLRFHHEVEALAVHPHLAKRQAAERSVVEDHRAIDEQDRVRLPHLRRRTSRRQRYTSNQQPA